MYQFFLLGESMQTIDVIGDNFHLEDLSWILTQPDEICIYDEETNDEKPLTFEHWNSIIPHMKQGDYIGFLCSRDGTKDLINEVIGENRPPTDPVTLKDLFEVVNRVLPKRYKDYNTSTTYIDKVIEIGRKDSTTLWHDLLLQINLLT